MGRRGGDEEEETWNGEESIERGNLSREKLMFKTKSLGFMDRTTFVNLFLAVGGQDHLSFDCDSDSEGKKIEYQEGEDSHEVIEEQGERDGEEKTKEDTIGSGKASSSFWRADILAQAFSVFDMDGDGFINFREFCCSLSICTLCKRDSDVRLRFLFHIFAGIRSPLRIGEMEQTKTNNKKLGRCGCNAQSDCGFHKGKGVAGLPWSRARIRGRYLNSDAIYCLLRSIAPPSRFGNCRERMERWISRHHRTLVRMSRRSVNGEKKGKDCLDIYPILID